MSDTSHPQHLFSINKENDDETMDKSTNNEIVLWKYDNPYANYKRDTERIFLLNGYTRNIYTFFYSINLYIYEYKFLF